MDVKGVVDFAKEHVKQLASWAWTMLSSPLQSGEAIRAGHVPGLPEKELLIPTLTTFVIICILIGATIGAVIPNRPKLLDRATVAVIASLLWVFIGFVAHGFCKLLRGAGRVEHSISAVVQVLAVIYPVSNFVVFLLSACETTFPGTAHLWTSLGVDSPRDHPGAWIIFIQALFMAIYLPMLFLRIHGFGLFRGIVSSAVAVSAASIFGLAIASTGGC